MTDELETIRKAIELAQVKLADLRPRCSDDVKKLNLIDDADQGLGWIARKLERLNAEPDDR